MVLLSHIFHRPLTFGARRSEVAALRRLHQYRPGRGAGEATVGALLLMHGSAALVTRGGAVRHCSDRTPRADMGWCGGGQGRPWVSEIDFSRIPCGVAAVARSFAPHLASKPSPDHLVPAGLRPPRPLASTAARPLLRRPERFSVLVWSHRRTVCVPRIGASDAHWLCGGATACQSLQHGWV